MKNFFQIMAIAAVCTVFVMGCAKQNIKNSGISDVISGSFSMKPGGMYEECIELGPGMGFNYSFDASDFVDFNIHYHAEDGIYYPVNKKGVMMGKGLLDPGGHEFYTEDQEAYCLMWENVAGEEVKVTFSSRLKKK